MDPRERLLRRLARPYYPAVGKRSWEHVNQVMRNAEMMTQGLDHRPLTLQEKAAILFHDCATQDHGGHKVHGRYGRDRALPLLLSTGLFNNKQLKEIGQAIVEHDELDGKGPKFSNTTADVLASGDANPPDLPWLLNKMYSWQIQHNPDKNDWSTNIYNTATKWYGEDSKEKFPEHYTKFHGDRVQQMRKLISSMSKEEMWDMVQKYRRKHHMRSNDERLGTPPMFQPA